MIIVLQGGPAETMGVLTTLKPLTISSAVSMLAMALAPPGTILIHWSARLADCNSLGHEETPRLSTGLAAITGAFLGSLQRSKSRWSQVCRGGGESYLWWMRETTVDTHSLHACRSSRFGKLPIRAREEARTLHSRTSKILNNRK